MESAPDLCSDIICEILSHSSMETVGRCRLLSKECNSLTYDSTFINLHCERTKTISGYFIQSMISNKFSSSFVSVDNSNSYPKLSLDFLPVRVKIVASTKQGILLCLDDRIPRYYVCKPTTNQWQKIPNPKTRFETLATGLIVIRSNPLHYKIIRFSQPRSQHGRDLNQYNWARCELFDSKTWTWKQLQEVKLRKPDLLVTSCMRSISACGSLHWLTWEKNIFAFHVEEERYSMFSLPLPVNDRDIELVEYEGKLGLICIGREESFMELWVMENYAKREWNKRHTISLEASRRKERYTSPVAFYNADIALMKDNSYCVTFFNFKHGCSDSVRLELGFNDGCFPFRSDFEHSDLRGEFALLKHHKRPTKRSSSKSN